MRRIIAVIATAFVLAAPQAQSEVHCCRIVLEPVASNYDQALLDRVERALIQRAATRASIRGRGIVVGRKQDVFAVEVGGANCSEARSIVREAIASFVPIDVAVLGSGSVADCQDILFLRHTEDGQLAIGLTSRASTRLHEVTGNHIGGQAQVTIGEEAVQIPIRVPVDSRLILVPAKLTPHGIPLGPFLPMRLRIVRAEPCALLQAK